ncbi:MAG TPA: hypothetical protein PKL92_01265 [Aquaticitalea sp.]|nr:hypothetical protein [Aquaticitalea sp.]
MERNVYRYQFFVLLFVVAQSIFAQQKAERAEGRGYFIVRGSVTESDTYKPIPKANVEVNGGGYTMTGLDGTFSIQVKKGDEITIRHKDFETVTYTIQNNERIAVEVEPVEPKQPVKNYKTQSVKAFNRLLDSAFVHLKKDAKKSIAFVAEALAESSSVSENAQAYELLGDIYMEWKQYDLAVSNYRISLQNSNRSDVKLKLAKAYGSNKNYQESIDTYASINTNGLPKYQAVLLYEGLGDTYSAIKNFEKAIENYQNGLQIAQKNAIAPKETDLNSKIAQTYNAFGKTDKAQDYFQNSLILASKENKKRAVEEKVKVADFQNTNKAYDTEIELREQILADVNEMVRDSAITNESPLTPQKQNTKSGMPIIFRAIIQMLLPTSKKV